MITPRDYLADYAEWVDKTAYAGADVDVKISGDRPDGGARNTLPLYATLGLAGETGEFVELIKKWARNPTNSRPPQEKLKSELGDVIWYVTRLCNQLGLTLAEVIEYNRSKIDRRNIYGKEAEAIKEGG